MKGNLLLFALSLLTSAPGLAQSGGWHLEEGDACSIVIVGPTGGSLSGAYRIRNSGKAKVALFLNKCAERCSPKDKAAGKCMDQCSKDDIAHNRCPNTAAPAPTKCPDKAADKSALRGSVILPVGNTIDLFVSSCLEVEEIDEDANGQIIGRGSDGTYENLSHVSAP